MVNFRVHVTICILHCVCGFKTPVSNRLPVSWNVKIGILHGVYPSQELLQKVPGQSLPQKKVLVCVGFLSGRVFKNSGSLCIGS